MGPNSAIGTTNFTNLVEGRRGASRRDPPDGNSCLLCKGPDLGEVTVLAREHRHTGPIGDAHLSEANEFSQYRLCLAGAVRNLDELHLALTHSVPAAKFPACIKIRSAYTYIDTTSNPLISGEASRWFARGVGIVKYQMPNGIGELLEAKLGDRILPAKK